MGYFDRFLRKYEEIELQKIHVLDEATIDKIAAGEVVERPSSVVKELVENAIDAGATSITVEIKDGGISFIRITDNGSGISADQIRIAFLRHATSKISSAEDLSSIGSLGFRGEALSSISAVAQVELITKTRDSLLGKRLLLEGPREVVFEDVGAPDGTTFLIRNLFFNTPVRRKFLKTAATEGGYIIDLMEHMALSRPDIAFKLIVGSQTKFYTTGNGQLKEVIYRIYGRDTANNVIPMDYEEGGIRIRGYLGEPSIVRSNRNYEIYFINGRFIKSNVISKAIEDGYKQYLMQHKFPFCVLHITVEDKSRVDVNVHPTKMEVRISDGPIVYNMIADAIMHRLANKEMIPETTLPKAKVVEQTSTDKKSEEAAKTPEVTVRAERKIAVEPIPAMKTLYEGAKVIAKPLPESISKSADQSSNKLLTNYASKAPVPSVIPVKKESAPEPFEVKRQESFRVMEELKYEAERSKMTDFKQETLFDEDDKLLSQKKKADYRIIGQVFDTYFMVQYEDQLMIIDQHAAHEKVKYERLIKRYQEKTIVSQNLMPPLVVSLSGQEEQILKEYIDIFKNMGFEVEHFGSNEYTIRAVPVDLYGCDEKQMFLEVLDQLAETGTRGNINVIEEKIASMSCKAAVKGNNRLSMEEAKALIDELLTLDNPYNCPHGRPTIISLTKYEMEKRFKR